MERHHQEFLPRQPLVVPRHHIAERLDRACFDISLEEEMQHGHEMTLTGTEAAVEVGRLAGVPLDRSLHQLQRLVETARELWRDDVVLECGLRVVCRRPIRKLEHKVSL